MPETKEKMPYVRLGNSGLKVSRFILGTMQYGSKEWQSWIIEEEVAIAHIKAAYDLGIQTFDTADVYSNGLSEVILGKAIRQLDLPRDNIVIMCKVGHFVPKGGPGERFVLTNKNPEHFRGVNQKGLNRKHIFEAVKASLQRLQLEYIDVLQCHYSDINTPIEETMVALHDVVKAGYVRYIGMGTCYAWQFHQMQNYAITNGLTPFISVQNQYNLLYRDDELELYPTLKLFDVGSLAFSPLARGYLAKPFSEKPSTYRAETDPFYPLYRLGPWEDDQEIIKRVGIIAARKGVSMSQIAIAWLLHQPGVTAPIVGPTSIEQLRELLDATSVCLSKEELVFLEEPYRMRPKLTALALSL